MNYKKAILRILPYSIAKITGKARYLPEIEWSRSSWVHNFFRFLEIIFWRKYEIRAEVSSGKFFDEENKRWFEYHVGHSLEGKLAIVEYNIRKVISGIKNFNIQLPRLILIPQTVFQTTNGLSLPVSNPFSFPYRFAIAYDALGESTTGFGVSPITWTHVTSGSNRALFISTAMPDNLTWSMTVTYNSTSLSDLGHTATDNGTADWFIGLFGMVAPTTGSNTCSVTSSNTLGGCSTSYTGVKQTGFPDSTGTANSGGSNVTSQNVSSTVVASGCWQVLSARSMTAVLSAGTATTLRGYGFMPTNKYFAIMDSNGTVGTGSQALQMSGSSSKMGGVVASFEPSASAVNSNAGFFALCY